MFKEKPFMLSSKRNKELEEKAKVLGQFAAYNWIDAADHNAATTRNAIDAVVKSSEYAFVIVSKFNVLASIDFVAVNKQPTKAAFIKCLEDFNATSYFKKLGVIVFTYEFGVRTSTKEGSLEEVISYMQ